MLGFEFDHRWLGISLVRGYFLNVEIVLEFRLLRCHLVVRVFDEVALVANSLHPEAYCSCAIGATGLPSREFFWIMSTPVLPPGDGQ